MTQQEAVPAPVSLDHAGLIVGDLDASSALVERLGFTLTARAEHSRTNEQGELVSAGSSQRSLMLRSGYIELMQITDPGAGHQLASAPTVRHGLHIVAFGTTDVEACNAQCLHNGVDAGPVLHWARRVDEAGAHGVAQFAYFGSAGWKPQDPSYLCWVQHQTPELLRSPALLQHANGSHSLREIRFRGPRRLAWSWAQALQAGGPRWEAEDDRGVSLALSDARIRVDFDDSQPAVLPSALVFELPDCQSVRARCAQLGLGNVQRDDGALDVNLTREFGLHWLFRPAP